MPNRRPANRAAQAAAIARKQQRPARPPASGRSGPVQSPTEESTRSALSTSLPPGARGARRDRRDLCPVCGADVFEEGGLGCCGAITATCDGSIDGVPIDWSAIETEEESDRLEHVAVRHNWYVDTLQPAPPEYGPPNGVTCRCGR